MRGYFFQCISSEEMYLDRESVVLQWDVEVE